MSTQFDSLLQAFFKSKGMETEESSLGLQFESEGIDILVVQHPLHEDMALIEATVSLIDTQQQAQLGPLLLQLNEVARFEHNWSIVMDERGQVSLSTSAPVAKIAVSELENLIADGIERAQTLATLLTQFANPEPTDPGQPNSEQMAAMMAIRG